MNSQVKPMTVEEWLALGNKPTVLPMGHTAYPDGNIPIDRSRKAEDLESKKKAIEAKNELIRQQKEAAKAEKRRRAAELKAERKAQRAKEKAMMPKVPKVKKPKPVVLELKTFPDAHPEYLRRSILSIKKRDAMARGERSFIGQCGYHGDVLYYIFQGRAACSRCRAKTRNGYSDEHLRRERIAEARREAVKAGEKFFIGECKKHGRAAYIVLDDNKSACRECRIEYSAIANEKIRHERKAKRLADRDEAVAQGKRFINADCEKHGFTTWRIRKDKSVECIECKRESDRSRKRGAYKDRTIYAVENRLRYEKAVELGDDRFMGLCIRHGETLYAVHEENPVYGCLKCKVERNKKCQQVNKDRYLSDPKTKDLLEWISKQPKGGKFRLARILDIRPQTLSHYMHGRGVIPDAKYELFKAFKEAEGKADEE